MTVDPKTLNPQELQDLRQNLINTLMLPQLNQDQRDEISAELHKVVAEIATRDSALEKYTEAFSALTDMPACPQCGSVDYINPLTDEGMVGETVEIISATLHTIPVTVTADHWCCKVCGNIFSESELV